ncbi:SGNH/GDSL hydrolase family protein [Pedobacter sp. L105]|uniref:SGNH/GDSL hydrolase family protein n=1 Tax=Pedobacter sp. L105 TaxID=1641871 RepID=UPI00131B84EE|nr:SGNH/GDSL hydrolase family protein [Pedobacter sp. L105]
MKFMLAGLVFIFCIGCKKSPVQETVKVDTVNPNLPSGQFTYLALGDSYTIGEAVTQGQSFPYQLTAAALDKQGLNVQTPTIIAQTGWTTGDLQQAIQRAALTSTYDIVTLLIGVNNQYQGASIATYRTEFSALLQTAISFARGDVTHVFVISIPDWGVTPFGLTSGRGQQNISMAIDAFNAVNQDEALKAGVNYVNITAESRTAASNLALVASDGLHPSDKMYQEWVSLMSPSVVGAFLVK